MKSNKGFSLVELIVVIAIMAIIAAVAIPVYSTYVSNAEDAVLEQAIADAKHAAEIAAIANGCDSVSYALDSADSKKLEVTFAGTKSADAVKDFKATITGSTTKTGAENTTVVVTLEYAAESGDLPATWTKPSAN